MHTYPIFRRCRDRLHGSPTIPFSVLLMLMMVPCLSSCGFAGGTNGSGNRIEEARPVDAYHSIQAGGRFELRLTQGPSGPVRLEGEDNILPLIESSVRGGVLYLDTEERLGRVQKIVVHASAPEWKSVALSGAGSMIGETPLSGKALRMRISGAGDVEAQVDVQDLEVEISGAGDASLSGSARKLQFKASGAGDLDALRLRCQDASVRISGAGSANVHVSGHLEASISGAGSVRYAGQPASIDQSVSGAGSIRALEAQ